MEDITRNGDPDRHMWWAAMAVLLALGVYVSMASSAWALTVGAALTLVFLLLNHKRMASEGAPRRLMTSVLLTVVAGLALLILHFTVGPALRG